ncbi:unnamed protein product [Parascedosporium putredinis]|uniref:Uncharacterized protein n=1 Tax=Parascedosporium putredinis TaxID=1442378 RepID=A0A9P1M8N9_9PEZI|nr:unnamed protein product [Parascedosporium putredinis]CAI7990474.1 unnamed protein product [Parascedosporium putredinis]
MPRPLNRDDDRGRRESRASTQGPGTLPPMEKPEILLLKPPGQARQQPEFHHRKPLPLHLHLEIRVPESPNLWGLR